MKVFKFSYLFMMLFLFYIMKEPIYKLFEVKEIENNTYACKLLEDDYNKLAEFNSIDLIYDTKSINSYIIYKDIYDYMNEITIRGGNDYNIKINDPVIYDNTLIGVISNVFDTYSIVRLITNKKSLISIKINNSVGVLEYDKGSLKINDIKKDNININDMVYTSGLGNIHNNIFIGKVKNIEKEEENYDLIIDYKINIKDIDYVTVLLEN